jgi:hypothetical protein
MKTQFTQWNKMGDHPLVKENSCFEFEYIQAVERGCGFIDTFKIVYPGNYIVEVNDVFVGVINQETYNKVNMAEQSHSCCSNEDVTHTEHIEHPATSQMDNQGSESQNIEHDEIPSHSEPAQSDLSKLTDLANAAHSINSAESQPVRLKTVDNDTDFLLFKEILNRHFYFYDAHSSEITEQLEAVKPEVYARVFKDYSNFFLALFAVQNPGSSNTYSYRAAKTIDTVFSKLNSDDVIDSYEYRQLFTLNNPLIHHLINHTNYDTFFAFLTRHKDFIGEYSKVLVDSFLLKNLVDFNDLNEASFAYLKKVVPDNNFAPNFQLLDKRWSKSFENADFDYKITGRRFKIIKLMLKHKFLKAAKYNFSEQRNGHNQYVSKDKRYSPTFFELFISNNINQARNQPVLFKYLLSEIAQLESLGIQKILSLNPKECFYYKHDSIDNPEDYEAIHDWNRFIDETECAVASQS